MSILGKSMAPALFLFFLGLAITTSETDPSYIYHFCSNSTTFTPNSTYQSNLNLLLSSLASNSIRNNNGFYNNTISQAADDTVYGLFLCRGDLSTDVCQDCVTFATQDVVQRCPVEKVAVIWYEECLLRYSNESFFNDVSGSSIRMFSTQNSSSLTSYQDLLRAAMNDQASRASESSQKFKVGMTNFPWSDGRLYMLTQCTQDLTENNCQRCLRNATSRLINGSIGGGTLTGSCIVRYEPHLFFNSSVAPDLLSPPLPPLSPSPSPLYLPPPPLYLPPPASHEGNF